MQIGRKLGITLAVFSGFLPADAAAQDVPFKTLVFLKGSCERLMLPSDDLTPSCKPTLVNLLYRNGRSSFAFSDGDRSMISFSGMGQKVSGDLATQPVDHMTISTAAGTAVKSEDATGICEFSNAYKGEAFVRCTGKTTSGEFSASFRTDGSVPNIQEF